MSMDTYGIIGFAPDNVGIDRRIYTGSAINGQTDPILAVSYNGGRVDVYLNGIKLVGDHSEMPSGTRDYTFTQTGQGSSIQLRTNVALVSADVVECVGHVGLGSNVVTSYNPTPANTDGGFNVFASINHTTSDLVNVFLNGVLLDDSDYTLDAGNNKVTILGATLTASDVVVIQVIGALDNSNFVSASGGTFTGNVVFSGNTTGVDVNGTELVLDADGDTSITADTDDRIDFRLAGVEHISINNASGDTMIKPMVDAKDIIIQQYDGNELVNFNDGGYSSFTRAAVNPEATLSDGATPAWNALTEPVAKITIAGNRTIGAASSGVTGQFISLLIIQDGTGSRTMTWNAAYEFKDDTAPTLTTTASKGDLFVFRYNGSKWLEVGRNQNLTLS